MKEFIPYRGGSTPYYELVVEALIALCRAGNKKVFQETVAKQMGRGVGEGLRRALKAAAGQGMLFRKDELGDQGGLRACYWFTPEFVQYVQSLVNQDAKLS